MKTRAELDKLVESMAAEYVAKADTAEPEQLARSLAELQDSIQAQATPEDVPHVWSRLQCVLRDAGLIPGDDEPCSE